jgi:putative membrane protein
MTKFMAATPLPGGNVCARAEHIHRPPAENTRQQCHDCEGRRGMVAGIALCALLAGQGVAQSPPSTADFVQKVAMSDMLEIQSSKLVQPKADRDTKPFAARMIKDHTKTSTELKRLVQSGKVEAELPTKLAEEHHSKLDELKNLGGKELDKAYDNMQVQAHQEAVELFTQYSQNGDNEDLKKWAAKTLPALKQHLRMAEKLK